MEALAAMWLERRWGGEPGREHGVDASTYTLSSEWCRRDRGRRLRVVSKRSRVMGDGEDDGDGGWLGVVSDRSREETRSGVGEIEGEGRV